MALAYWRGSKTLLSGGDTLEAMKGAGVSKGKVSHVSIGGSATLRFLAGDEMPGIDIRNKSRLCCERRKVLVVYDTAARLHYRLWIYVL